MKMKNLLLVLAGIIVLGISCEYEYIQPLDIVVPDDFSFASHVEPMFSKCAGCHSGTTPPDFSKNIYDNLLNGTAKDGTRLVNTSTPEDSFIYTFTAEHPGGGSSLTAEERGFLLAWIQRGANND